MSQRFSSVLLSLIIAGAVLDGGTLGFRAAWASCGDWLAQHAADASQRNGFTIDQVSTDLSLRFSAFFLREDERPEQPLRAVNPRSTPCDGRDPACSAQPFRPALPVPVHSTWDADRDAIFSSGAGEAERGGRLLEIPSRDSLPLRRPADVFRPPRELR